MTAKTVKKKVNKKEETVKKDNGYNECLQLISKQILIMQDFKTKLEDVENKVKRILDRMGL